jgi:ADP-ribosyl-[dinitrogen reductase] hydrolase
MKSTHTSETGPTHMFERIEGAILGTAIGDSMGLQVEGMIPGFFQRMTGMKGGEGTRNYPVGLWSDDTALTLMTADSLMRHNGFKSEKVMRMFASWLASGQWTADGQFRGIGKTTEAAIQLFIKGTPASNCGGTREYDEGNGALIRMSPIAAYYSYDRDRAILMSILATRITHARPVCVDTSTYFVDLLVSAINGQLDKNDLSPKSGLLSDYIRPMSIVFKKAHSSNGHAPTTLQAALDVFVCTNSFEEGVLEAVNRGYDADSVGAVYGALAGAYYGRGAIPEEWQKSLMKYELIDQTAVRLGLIAEGIAMGYCSPEGED